MVQCYDEVVCVTLAILLVQQYFLRAAATEREKKKHVIWYSGAEVCRL